MKTTEVHREIIGRRCECIFRGMIVPGIIEDIRKDSHTTDVKVRFDEAHQWGDDEFKYEWAWGRKVDELGTLQYLQLLPETVSPAYRTLSITFAGSIHTLDDIFDDPQMWGVSTLKEWVDHYESTRFTQTGDHTAIVTSEYNMDCVLEWLQKNTPITIYETLD